LECNAVSSRSHKNRLVPQRTKMVWSGRTRGVHGRGGRLGDYPAAWEGICDVRVCSQCGGAGSFRAARRVVVLMMMNTVAGTVQEVQSDRMDISYITMG
jgi:hypothetical protein